MIRRPNHFGTPSRNGTCKPVRDARSSTSLRPKLMPLTRRRKHSFTRMLCAVKQRSHNPRDAVKRGRLRLPIYASRDRHQEWLRFLPLIDRQVPEDKVLSVQMHVLCDSGDAACFSARSLV